MTQNAPVIAGALGAAAQHPGLDDGWVAIAIRPPAIAENCSNVMLAKPARLAFGAARMRGDAATG